MITIISPTPGPTTTERIQELILSHPQGITIKALSDRLNRPVSMIQHCLNYLISIKAVNAKLSKNGKYWLYYPVSTEAFCS